MKYLVHTFGFALTLGIAGVVFAQEGDVLIVDTLTNIPNLTDASSANNIPDFLQNLYRYGIGIAAILAVVMITYGGFQYMTSEIPGVKADKRERVVQAVFGLILVLLPFLVFSIINPQILDLDPGFERIYTEQNEVNITRIGDLDRQVWGECPVFQTDSLVIAIEDAAGLQISQEELVFRQGCCQNQEGCSNRTVPLIEPNTGQIIGNQYVCDCESSTQEGSMLVNTRVEYTDGSGDGGPFLHPLMVAENYNRQSCFDFRELSPEEQSSTLVSLYNEGVVVFDSFIPDEGKEIEELLVRGNIRCGS